MDRTGERKGEMAERLREDRRLADGGHDEDWKERRREEERIRERTDTKREWEKTKEAQRYEKKERTREKERRSERTAAGAVGYLLVIQPLTMPL